MTSYYGLFNWVLLLLLALQQINRLILVLVWVILGSKCMIHPTWNSASSAGAWTWTQFVTMTDSISLAGCTHEPLTSACRSSLGRITPHWCWLPCAADASLGGTAELVDGSWNSCLLPQIKRCRVASGVCGARYTLWVLLVNFGNFYFMCEIAKGTVKPNLVT